MTILEYTVVSKQTKSEMMTKKLFIVTKDSKSLFELREDFFWFPPSNI